MKLLRLVLYLIFIGFICGCASVSPEPTQKAKTAKSAKKPGKVLQKQKSAEVPVKNQSRSGVFCGDREVSDDF